MKNTLRLRLIIGLSILIAIVAVIQGVTAYQAALREADGVFDYYLQQMATSLEGGVSQSPQAKLQVPAAGSVDFIVQIWSEDGTKVYQSRAIATLPDHAVLGFSEAPNGQGKWRVYSIQAPTQTIQVVQDMSVRRRMASSLAWHTVWPLLLFVPLLLLLVVWEVNRSLRPISRVRQSVATRQVGDLSPLPEQGLPDEVLPLVVEINQLFARVQTSFSTQRQFIADAAHELRSPLTALKLQAQSLLREQSAEINQTGMRRLLDGIERAGRLVEQLLTLARQEAVSTSLATIIQGDLSRVLLEEAGDCLPMAEHRQQSLQVETTDGVLVAMGDDTLHRVIRNLLDNAIKYTPVGGTISISMGMDNEHVWFEIGDSGQGIPDAEQDRIFDRFYRVPSTAGHGAGLGMSIVQTAVNQHRGQLVLGTSSLGGLSVRVILPRVTAA